MRHGSDIRARQAPHFAFQTLHALPCGCVAAVYLALPLDSEVVSVEARGPHCLYFQHQVGRLLGLGSRNEDAVDFDR